jgi:NAD(P)H dehydrogenase (quinone)
MLKKKILIIDGHPNEHSFCAALSEAYYSGANQSRHMIETLVLRDLKFDLNLHRGYTQVQDLEPDLIEAQKKIERCEHLVFVYPIWWGSMPALVKGFLDRCWLPGFAFKYHKTDPFWDRLLKGRSARMVVTSDAPYLFNLFAYFNAPYLIMKKTVLGFCGFKPIKSTFIGGVKNLDQKAREKILMKVKALGLAGK